MNGASGGYGVKVTNPGEGQYIGATGLGPCVGAIIIAPNYREFYSFHFTAMDSIKSTLKKHRFPKRSKVIIFGGDKHAPSRSGLKVLKNFFDNSKYNLIDYVDTSGLWTDKNGHLYSRGFERRK